MITMVQINCNVSMRLSVLLLIFAAAFVCYDLKVNEKGRSRGYTDKLVHD